MTTARRTRIWLTPATAVLVVAVMATGAATSALVGRHIRGKLTGAATVAAPSQTPPQPTYTVAGKIRLQTGQYARDGHACRSTTGAAQVIVTDAAGAALTYGEVGVGQVADGHCELPFTLTVPAGEGTYGVDVPTWGLAKYSERELADSLELTFG